MSPQRILNVDISFCPRVQKFFLRILENKNLFQILGKNGFLSRLGQTGKFFPKGYEKPGQFLVAGFTVLFAQITFMDYFYCHYSDINRAGPNMRSQRRKLCSQNN